MLPQLGDAAKEQGKPVDENYDSSDDEDELAGVVRIHLNVMLLQRMKRLTSASNLPVNLLALLFVKIGWTELGLNRLSGFVVSVAVANDSFHGVVHSSSLLATTDYCAHCAENCEG